MHGESIGDSGIARDVRPAGKLCVGSTRRSSKALHNGLHFIGADANAADLQLGFFQGDHLAFVNSLKLAPRKLSGGYAAVNCWVRVV